jgi:hypothetical protein
LLSLQAQRIHKAAVTSCWRGASPALQPAAQQASAEPDKSTAGGSSCRDSAFLARHNMQQLTASSSLSGLWSSVTCTATPALLSTALESPAGHSSTQSRRRSGSPWRDVRVFSHSPAWHCIARDTTHCTNRMLKTCWLQTPRTGNAHHRTHSCQMWPGAQSQSNMHSSSSSHIIAIYTSSPSSITNTDWLGCAEHR